LQPAAAGLEGSDARTALDWPATRQRQRAQRDDRSRVRDRRPQGRDGAADSTKRHAKQSPAPSGGRKKGVRPTHTPDKPIDRIGKSASWAGRPDFIIPAPSTHRVKERCAGKRTEV